MSESSGILFCTLLSTTSTIHHVLIAYIWQDLRVAGKYFKGGLVREALACCYSSSPHTAVAMWPGYRWHHVAIVLFFFFFLHLVYAVEDYDTFLAKLVRV